LGDNEILKSETDGGLAADCVYDGGKGRSWNFRQLNGYIQMT